MKTIYKITPKPDAPELILDPELSNMLTGQPLSQISPDKPFSGKITDLKNWNEFYRIGKNGFTISEEAWNHCMEMYYVITENAIELLSVRAGNTDLRIINPLQIIPRSTSSDQLCNMENINSLFRLKSNSDSGIFCFEGLPVPENEFKHCYEKFGFHGLTFEKAWP